MDDFTQLRLKVEAILFSVGDWVSMHNLEQVLEIDSELLLTNALKELEGKYFHKDYSFCLEQSEDGQKWRMTLKDKFSHLSGDLVSSTEIPPKVLKVLSVIAYEQPITKTRLSEILGKSVKTEVEYLYKLKFLSYQKQGIGKYYKVTKKFYDYFQLDKDEDFKSKANKNMTTFLQEPFEEEAEELDLSENKG